MPLGSLQEPPQSLPRGVPQPSNQRPKALKKQPRAFQKPHMYQIPKRKTSTWPPCGLAANSCRPGPRSGLYCLVALLTWLLACFHSLDPERVLLRCESMGPRVMPLAHFPKMPSSFMYGQAHLNIQYDRYLRSTIIWAAQFTIWHILTLSNCLGDRMY